MILRPATIQDLAPLVELVNQAYRPAKNRGGWTHESELVAGQRITSDALSALIQAAGSHVLLAQQEEQTVGCVHIQICREGLAHAEIGMLAVLPHLQNIGLGKKLLQAAENFITEHYALRRYVIHVLTGRASLRDFYVRRGYQSTGELSNYPLHANVGQPKSAGLQVETMEKFV